MPTYLPFIFSKPLQFGTMSWAPVNSRELRVGEAKTLASIYAADKQGTRKRTQAT